MTSLNAKNKLTESEEKERKLKNDKHMGEVRERIAKKKLIRHISI